MADALSVKIDDLITGADSLSAAAASIATITSGSDVVVSNFDHVEDVFSNLQDFLTELKAGSWYAPVGLVSPFAGASAPAGWLLCNGDTVPNGAGTVQSKTANFAELYSVVGAAYGSAGKLPDLRGRVPLADDASTYLRGASGGGTATLGVNNLPAHTHSVSETSTGGTAYASIVNNTNFAAGSGIGQRAIVNTSQAGGLSGYEGLSSFGTAPNHTHSVSVSGGGNGTSTGNAFNTIPPYVVTNFIIKF